MGPRIVSPMPMLSQIGRQISQIKDDHVEVKVEIGTGNFSDGVFFGKYKGAKVALKKVDEATYLREAEFLFEFSDHPNICRVTIKKFFDFINN